MKKLVDELKGIRDFSAEVVSSTSMLSIDDKALSQVVTLLPQIYPQKHINAIASAKNLAVTEKILICLLFGSVNYCFVDPPTGIDYSYIDRDGRVHKRSKAFLTALINRQDHIWNSIDRCVAMSEMEWIEMLHLNDTGTILWEARDRYNRFILFAKYLKKKVPSFDDFFQVYNTAQKVYELLIGSKLFDDEFLKRLQIEILWLDEIAQSNSIPFESNSNMLTAMADYRIPQLLMHFGIINITKNNIKKMKKQLLDTDLERTVRAATINACQRIANKCNLSEAETDKLLWILSQNMLEKDFLKTPMMRVATKHY